MREDNESFKEAFISLLPAFCKMAGFTLGVVTAFIVGWLGS